MPAISRLLPDPLTRSPDKPVFVARSAIHGLGLFAARRLPAGQLIGVYEGPVVTENGSHVLWIEDEVAGDWIGYDGKNDFRYLNHSDSPNAEMDGLNCFALTDIEAGDEITIDYGWEES